MCDLRHGGCFYVVRALVAKGHILTVRPCGLLPQVVEEPYVLAIGVVPINHCKCGLVGIQGRKWLRRWHARMGRRFNTGG